MESRIQNTLRAVPERTLDSLTFCQSQGSTYPAAVESWLTELSGEDPKKQGQQLASALKELLLFAGEPNACLLIADKLMNASVEVIEALTKAHLIHSVIFNATQQECFDICASLHHNITFVYRSIAENSSGKEQHKTLSCALHRAMAQSTYTVLFYHQLYRPVASGIWLEQHYLFQLATQHKLTKFNKPPLAHGKTLSIAHLYQRSLLFSHSRTNKLSYEEIQLVWQALGLWSPHSKLKKTSGLKTFFAVNLTSDTGLYYASPDPDKEIANVLGLDCRILTAHLKKLIANPGKTEVLSTQLINHLMSAWAQISIRKHSRVAGNGTCKISIGLSSSHYHLSGQQDFNNIIAPFIEQNEAKDQTFEAEDNDVWAKAHDVERDKKTAPASEEDSPVIEFGGQSSQNAERHFKPVGAKIINFSDGGFSLEIKLPDIKKMVIGDIVAVQATEKPGWLLSVVRWVEILPEKILRMGVETLSSQAEPCAIALTHKSKGSMPFQRCFLLPDQPEKGQHSSLIMSSFSVKPGMKYELLHQETVKKGQLDKCMSNTSVYSEFQYRSLT